MIGHVAPRFRRSTEERQEDARGVAPPYDRLIISMIIIEVFKSSSRSVKDVYR